MSERRITVAVHGFHHQGIVFTGIPQLIVDANRRCALVAVESADRTGSVGIGDRRAHVFHGQSHRGQPRRVHAHADRRLFGAGHCDIGDAGYLRETLGDHAVGGVIDRTRLHGLGGERQDQDRRCGRIGLAECWQGREVGRKVAERGVECGLHVAGSTLDAAREIELYGDARLAQRSHRGELGDAGNLAKPALEGAATVAAIMLGSAPGRLALTLIVGNSTLGRLATGRNI